MKMLVCLVCLGICSLSIVSWTSEVQARPKQRASTWRAIAKHAQRTDLKPYSLLPWLDMAPLTGANTPTQTTKTDWPMPRREMWTVVDGQPIVGTPQLDELRVPVTHKRQTRLSWILSRFKLKARDLHRWNPGVDFNKLEIGQNLLLWRRQEGVISQSIGKASRGKLLNGEPLPAGNKYVIMFEHRAFGTYYTVSELQRIMAAYEEAYPRADPLIIGDLSYRTGRRIKPHISHRSGRDVDITYPRHDKAPNFKRFHRVRRSNINMEETLFLIKRMLDSGMVELLLIDRPIQRRLYQYAKSKGAPDAWLEAVFQYPRYAGGNAIIRHARGHDDHFHVRFYCQPTDYRCK